MGESLQPKALGEGRGLGSKTDPLVPWVPGPGNTCRTPQTPLLRSSPNHTGQRIFFGQFTTQPLCLSIKKKKAPKKRN